mmetsp:Transcript_84577/g.217920  ORF Transcript_84577/g.217920 Transcript_84577/m.217920 type:complete len:240 (+) Transcript_84577:119-838(+)
MSGTLNEAGQRWRRRRRRRQADGSRQQLMVLPVPDDEVHDRNELFPHRLHVRPDRRDILVQSLRAVLVGLGLLFVLRLVDHLLEEHRHGDVDEDDATDYREGHEEDGRGQGLDLAGDEQDRPRNGLRPGLRRHHLEHGVERLGEVAKVLIPVVLAAVRLVGHLDVVLVHPNAVFGVFHPELDAQDGVDTHDQHEDREGVHDPGHGPRERRHDLSQGLDPLEEPEHAERAQHSQHLKRAR